MLIKKMMCLVAGLTILVWSHAQQTIHCLIKTSLGDISVALYPGQAPVTVQNFLYYVDHHLYDSSSFFRVCTPANEADRAIPIQVVQGGNVAEANQAKPIAMETTKQTGLHHINGALSMARDKPNSAASEFFICINDQPELDFAGKRNPDGQGFAVFGKVITGMEVVSQIQQQPNKGQRLLQPVIIYTITRTKNLNG
jgi:peptidyl-prolyl cis-trans isomerase A (cyclophilin A)